MGVSCYILDESDMLDSTLHSTTGINRVHTGQGEIIFLKVREKSRNFEKSQGILKWVICMNPDQVLFGS